MHLSREELLEAIYRNNSIPVFGVYEEWLDPVAGRIGGEPAEAPEQVKGRPVDGPESVSEASGAIYSEMGLDSEGLTGYTTAEDDSYCW